MVIHIQSNVSQALQTDTKSRTNRTEGSAGEQTAKSKKSPGADAVTLTSSATRLNELAGQLASEPAVDQSRVEALKQRVESGEYSIDENRVARKMLDFERLLP